MSIAESKKYAEQESGDRMFEIGQKKNGIRGVSLIYVGFTSATLSELNCHQLDEVTPLIARLDAIVAQQSPHPRDQLSRCCGCPLA
jgi:hypothetical protein